jgi:hypothetical protein
MHLQDKFVVRKLGEDDFVVGHRAAPRGKVLPCCMGAKRHDHYSVCDMPRMKADSKGQASGKNRRA